jgi:sugar lactone lactonase YvrE
MKRNSLYLLFIVAFSLLNAACGPVPPPENDIATAVPEAIETPTPEPIATPTAEPTATPAAEPTNTPENAEMEAAEIPEVVTSFDTSRGELPEGIAIDKEGNIYVSLGPPLFVGGGFGEIWKISPDGEKTTLAQFDGGPPAAGLAVDASGNLYYAYPSGEEETQGVYRLTADGDAERLPGTEAIILVNGLAFDSNGNLYVSDSILGVIWRIPPGGSVELWMQHELLAGCLKHRQRHPREHPHPGRWIRWRAGESCRS